MIWIIILFILLLAALFFTLASPIGDGSAYRPSLVIQAMLAETRLAEDGLAKDGEAKLFGGGGLEQRAGLYVLRLSGSPYEMGYQHGKLLSEEIRRGAVPYYERAIDNLAPFNAMSAPLRWLLRRYFDWTILRPLVRHSPPGFLEELKGLADGSGLPFEVIVRGNLLSELSTCLGRRMARRYAGQLLVSECTSLAAFGAMSADGDLIVGRNTDYWGAGLWDQYQTVVFYQPEDGYHFVNVSSAGLLKCNSCLNQHGLFLGGHFLLSDDVEPSGVGFTAFELEIMKRAATIDEAYRIVAENRRAGAFAFLVADGKGPDAAVIEASASAVGLRFAQGECAWETNFSTTPESQPHDVMSRYDVNRNSLARYERVRQLLTGRPGRIDPQMAAHFMGDHLDVCSGELRPTGHVIGSLINVSSAVFNLTTFDLWVASGSAPVANNPYIGFNLTRELDGDPRPPDPPVLQPNLYAKSEAFKALRRYYQAAVALTIPPLDAELAFRIVQELAEGYPEQVVYQMAGGQLALRRMELDLAQKRLEHALHLALSPNERALTHLLLGNINDLRGQREAALHCYRQILRLAEGASADPLRAINPFVQAAARRYRLRPFSPAQAAALEFSPEMSGTYER
ncbi:MAG: hypothetical protein JXA78_16545 [Anaerolineales bacterium]|nr:hypothetical protein [Anaerolineales bacterium]